MKEIKEQLEEAGYDYAIAIATEAEIEAGAACGQLSIITNEKEEEEISDLRPWQARPFLSQQ